MRPAVRVKICGITRPDDAALAAALGASAIGLVLWPGSPRAVTSAQARAVIAAVPPLTNVVGVFVDQPVAQVASMATDLGLGAVQLHGSEPLDDLDRVPCRVIKALDVGSYDTNGWRAVSSERVTILLDAIDPVRRGGTGQVVDWDAAARVARTRRVILAGGLGPENVAEAIRVVEPYAVDVASGVEHAPGRKDHDRLRAFMAAVLGAE